MSIFNFLSSKDKIGMYYRAKEEDDYWDEEQIPMPERRSFTLANDALPTGINPPEPTVAEEDWEEEEMLLSEPQLQPLANETLPPVVKAKEAAAPIANPVPAFESHKLSLDTEFVLGGRQESINGFFDDVSQLMTLFQSLQGNLQEKQTQLRCEFAERGRERAEFIALTNAYNTARDQVALQLAQTTELRQQFAAVTRERQAAQHALTAAESSVDAAYSDIKRLNAELLQHRAEIANATQCADRAIGALTRTEQEREQLNIQFNELSVRCGDLEGQLQASGQMLLSAEAERDALRKLYDEQTAQATALTRRAAELEDLLATDRQALSMAEERLRQTQANFSRLSVDHEDLVVNSRNQAKQDAIQIETALSKLRRLEQDNASMAQQIQVQNELNRTHSRRLSDAAANQQRLEERVEAADADISTLRQNLQASEMARSVAVDRADHLWAALEKRKFENEQLEARCLNLQAALEKQDSRTHIAQANSSERERQLAELVERTRSENAMLSGALEEARRDRNRMIGELQNHLHAKVERSALPPSIQDIFNGLANDPGAKVDSIIS